jgi:hypothetical protein
LRQNRVDWVLLCPHMVRQQKESSPDIAPSCIPSMNDYNPKLMTIREGTIMTTEATIKIEGMSCQHCVMSVKKALGIRKRLNSPMYLCGMRQSGMTIPRQRKRRLRQQSKRLGLKSAVDQSMFGSSQGIAYVPCGPGEGKELRREFFGRTGSYLKAKYC